MLPISSIMGRRQINTTQLRDPILLVPAILRNKSRGTVIYSHSNVYTVQMVGLLLSYVHLSNSDLENLHIMCHLSVKRKSMWIHLLYSQILSLCAYSVQTATPSWRRRSSLKNFPYAPPEINRAALTPCTTSLFLFVPLKPPTMRRGSNKNCKCPLW